MISMQDIIYRHAYAVLHMFCHECDCASPVEHVVAASRDLRCITFCYMTLNAPCAVQIVQI